THPVRTLSSTTLFRSDLAGPRHLGHVHQALDALLELDEGAVVLDADHLALDHGAGDVLLLGVDPRVGGDLLEAQAHPLAVGVELDRKSTRLNSSHVKI